MTTITKVGGVVVVTQVIPQDESSIPLQTGAPASQAPPPAAKAPPTAPTKLNGMTAAFLRGEPQGLGVVQIIIGVLCVLFSVTAVYSPALIFHVPLCATVSFVVSGSLAVAAARRTSVRLVQVSLVWNVISAVVGVVGVAYVCWLLAAHPPAAWFCDTEVFRGEVPTDHEWVRCVNMMRILNVPMYGPLGLLLVLLILQVCVAVTVCVFSVKAVRSHELYSPVQVEVNDCQALLVGAASAHDSDVGLLDGDEDETLTSPPDSP